VWVSPACALILEKLIKWHAFSFKNEGSMKKHCATCRCERFGHVMVRKHAKEIWENLSESEKTKLLDKAAKQEKSSKE
jgi:hypothetical protein